MSLKKTYSVLFMLCFVFGVSVVNAADYTNNLQTLVLDDFEMDGEDSTNPKILWKIIPNTFGREGNRPNGKSMQRIAWVKAWPEAYFGLQGSFFFGADDSEISKQRYTDVSNHCLGLNIKFNRQGYNYVDLYPIKKIEDSSSDEKSEGSDDGEDKYEITTLQFKGKVEQFDFWVWGANYDYYMECIVQDYRGVQHRLDVGSIRHVGWKNFNIIIPKQIPQKVEYIPQTKALSLVKFTIWTNPNEKVNGATVYIDHIKYLTDVYENNFDGYELGVPSKVEELWKEGEKEDIQINYLP